MKNNKLCVLIATELMGIGGAETHIYELCRALKAKGIKPVLVSSGGILADSLCEDGIVKYDIPLRSKNPATLLSSYKKLCRIIKKEKCNILHAHSRIPALLLHIIAKQKKIPFVVTDHAKFENSSVILKLLSRWGDKTLAVSQDLKNYLLKNYKSVKEENIYLTINGIDTEKFKNRIDDQSFVKETCNSFNLPTDKKIILSVSRLDTTAYLCVYELLSVAEKLAEKNPDSVLVIAGGGELFEDISEKVRKTNKQIGREFIYITGPTKDVYKLCSICTVFVGCARSALEAITCKKPSLIAGNGGYIGLACEKNLEFCLNSNFTARGVTEFSLTALCDDICDILKNPHEYDENCATMKKVTDKHYSVEKMADDCINAYYKAAQAANGKYDCTITGYYGHGNMGDDTMLSAVVENLRKLMPGLKICALCNGDKELVKAMSSKDVCIKNRFNPFSVFASIKNSHALIFGGGTLLQDNTSTKSLLYYLALLKIASLMNKKIILYANGIGPVKRASNLKKVKKYLPKCTLITLRDKQSEEFLNQADIKTDNTIVTADEALTLTPPDDEICRQTLELYGLENKKYLLVSLRKWKTAPEKFVNIMQNSIRRICREKELLPVFVIMEQRHDKELTCAVAKAFPDGKIIYHSFSPQTFLALVKRCEAVLSMRLHTLIFAGLCEKKMFGITYDPKVEGFLESIGLEKSAIKLENTDEDILTTEFLFNYDNQNTEGYKEYIRQSKSKAVYNAYYAAKALCGEICFDTDVKKS